MPSTFLEKDFLWDRIPMPEHIEAEPVLFDHQPDMWCLMGLNHVIKCIYPLAINIEGAEDSYNLALGRLNLLREIGDRETEVSVVGPGNFNKFVRSVRF